MKKDEFIKNYQQYLKDDKKRNLIITPVLGVFLFFNVIFVIPLAKYADLPNLFWLFYLVIFFLVLIPFGIFGFYHLYSDSKKYKLFCDKCSHNYSKEDCKIVTSTDKCPYCGKRTLQ